MDFGPPSGGFCAAKLVTRDYQIYSSLMDTNKKNICPHCKQEVDSKASRCPHCQGKISWFSKLSTGKKVLVGFLLFMGFTFFIGLFETEPTPVTTQPEVTAEERAAWEAGPAGRLCAKYPSWKKEDCDMVAAEQVWVGMTYEMLVYQLGQPDTTNPSNYGSGIQYQYCWRNQSPSCFYDRDGDEVIDAYN